MAADARGPAYENGAPDEASERAPKRTPAGDPPPPGFLDLGNGQLWGAGTADDFRAAAAWLARNYPEHSQDPAREHLDLVILNMLIHHSQMLRGFARLPNETLRDERLSIAARGHLAYLLSMPNGWNTTADAEAKRARSLRGKRGEGRDAMRRIYAELKEHGYIRYVKTQDNGTWSTEIYVFDRPCTDERLTGVPETRMPVPPAEMPEHDDYGPDEFSQVAPMYGSPGVGSPDVGSPVHRQAVHSYEDGTTEDLKDELVRVDDEVGDWGVRGNHPRHQEDDGQDQDQDPAALRLPQAANSQKPASSRLNDQPVADDERRFPPVDPDSTTDGSSARESVMRLGRWKSPQEIAAEQAAESRARREAAGAQ